MSEHNEHSLHAHLSSSVLNSSKDHSRASSISSEKVPHLCCEETSPTQVDYSFRPDPSMTSQQIISSEHCYSKSHSDNTTISSKPQNSSQKDKKHKSKEMAKNKRQQGKSNRGKKKVNTPPSKMQPTIVKDSNISSDLTSNDNRDKSENSSQEASPNLNRPEIGSEVPFDKDGKLFETISNLSEVNEDGDNAKASNTRTRGTSKSQIKVPIKDEDSLNSTIESSTPSFSGRSQRVRKKPKRWTDDQVEVDYTVVPSFLFGADDNKNAQQESKNEQPAAKKRQKAQKTNHKVIIIEEEKPEEVKEDEQSSDESSSSNDSDSDFSVDDNPQELWCICRKPYSKRFMIGCDVCEEWFHGECVGVTRAQGRKIEKAQQEWFCPSCAEGLQKDISRENLKELAQTKLQQIKEEEERARGDKKVKKPESSPSSAQKSQRDAIESAQQSDELDSDLSDNDVAKSPHKSHKQTKVIKEIPRKESKESVDRRKLQKLIKASKKDMNEKQRMFKSKEELHLELSTDQSELSLTNLDPNSTSSNLSQDSMQKSKAEPTTPKKKHKTSPIDQSAQDLFKAEPVLVRSLSTSSAVSVGSTTPLAAGPRKSSGPTDSRRASMSNSGMHSPSPQLSENEISCPSGCGKSIRADKVNVEPNSIYCNNTCIQAHVADALKYLRSERKQKGDSFEQQKPLRVVLHNRLNNKVLSGKDAILEKDVLNFITKNPMFEVHKLHNGMDTGKSNLSSANQNTHKSTHFTGQLTPKETPTLKSLNEHKKSHSSSSSSNNSSSSAKLQRSSSISEQTPDKRREYVRKQLKEIFESRYKELSSKDQSKVSPASYEKLSNKIEEEINKAFKSNVHKYTNKSRSLMFNLKDQKNSLFRKVLLSKISPERLVNMTAEQLASTELARWRENEKKTTLELIKRDAVDQANQVIVKKTHKGEEFITENDLISELNSETVPIKAEPNAGDKATEVSAPKAPSATLVAGKNESAAPLSLDVFDTTSQHKSHVFSNSCKICASGGDAADDTKRPVKKPSSSSIASSSNSQSSSSTKSYRSQPKRVRVEPESSNKFLQQVAKLSDKILSSSTSESSKTDSSKTTPESELPSPSPKNFTQEKTAEQKNLESSKSRRNSEPGDGSKVSWKGTIFMQDVAKFVASANNISGSIASNLSQDINDQITVCGRITPEQVSDYISKLRSSKRTEIGIVQFSWVSREERTGYDAFFNYLHARGRYGVVGNSGRTFKDFYILPLPQNHDIPRILHPIEGPGVPKKMHRPNLLLGILIRSRKHSPPQQTSVPLLPTISQSSAQVTSTSSQPERSYTPPLSNIDTPSQKDANSYTPPRVAPSQRSTNEPQSHESSNKISKYDPEEIKISNSSKTSSAHMNDLMEQLASSSNPVEMTPSVLSAIATSDNHELKRRLLNQLTAKVEDQRRILEIQRQETEEKINQNPTGVLQNSVSLNSVLSNFKNIQIPDNLKDILKNVQEKTAQIETQQGHLAALCESLDSKMNHPESSNSNKSKNDPRLRSKASNDLPQPDSTELAPLPASQPVTNMSQDELLRMAREQMDALEQMKHTPAPRQQPPTNDITEQFFDMGRGPCIEQTVSSSKPTEQHMAMPKISFSWKKKK